MAEEDKTIKQDLNSCLKKLSEIGEWFEGQEDVDVEEGLKRVKEAAILIKASKERLKAVKNEFDEIKKEIDLEEDGEESEKEDAGIEEDEDSDDEMMQ